VPATSRTASASLPLDDWLPKQHATTHHARSSRATPARLWEAARAVQVRETRSLRPIIAWRLGRYAPATEDAAMRDVLAAHPFHLLVEDGMVSVSGLAGKLWSLGDTFVRFDGPEAFRAWREPGYCKVAVRHEVVLDGAGAAILSEVGIWCTDRSAQLRFRPYWAFIGPFSHFIGAELLTAAVRRAERTSAATD
jgi:hypothetical protein